MRLDDHALAREREFRDLARVLRAGRCGLASAFFRVNLYLARRAAFVSAQMGSLSMSGFVPGTGAIRKASLALDIRATDGSCSLRVGAKRLTRYPVLITTVTLYKMDADDAVALRAVELLARGAPVQALEWHGVSERLRPQLLESGWEAGEMGGESSLTRLLVSKEEWLPFKFRARDGDFEF